MIPTTKIGQLLLYVGIFFCFAVGVVLSIASASPDAQSYLRSLFTISQQKPADIANPVEVPKLLVDSWVGNGLPTITPTPSGTTGITETPTLEHPPVTETISPSVTVTTTPSVTHTPLVTHTATPLPTTVVPTHTATPVVAGITPPPTQSGDPLFVRKVTLIKINPTIQCRYKNNQTMTLTQCIDWNDPDTLANGVSEVFKRVTNNHVNFNIVERYTLNAFPAQKQGCFLESYWAACTASGTCSRPDRCTNGFAYTANEWFDCREDNTKCIQSETDIQAMLRQYGFPTKSNNGSIDEVWIYGAPWMNMWESMAIGPRAFDINGSPVVDSSYSRTMVVMPMSYERDLGTSLHNFGHRLEATMSTVYGSWAENRIDTGWDKFGLVKVQSPNYSFSGCGSAHFPPNAQGGYDYGNHNVTTNTSCDLFYNYPNISSFGQATRPVTCVEWGCTEEGYFEWYYKHLPRNPGIAPDGKANDWWYYYLILDNVFRPANNLLSK